MALQIELPNLMFRANSLLVSSDYGCPSHGNSRTVVAVTRARRDKRMVFRSEQGSGRFHTNGVLLRVLAIIPCLS